MSGWKAPAPGGIVERPRGICHARGLFPMAAAEGNQVPATHEPPDPAAGRRFTADLLDRVRRNGHPEGTEAADLDARVGWHTRRCRELRDDINRWAGEIFAGRAEFDQTDEDVLKAEAHRRLRAASEAAAAGRAGAAAGLADLHAQVADFDFLLRNWVSPQLAVRPAARVVIPEAADRQIRERIAALPPLPADWQPADPEQRARFERLRAAGPRPG